VYVSAFGGKDLRWGLAEELAVGDIGQLRSQYYGLSLNTYWGFQCFCNTVEATNPVANRDGIRSLSFETPGHIRIRALQALTPAMVAWRKRLGFITERFEAASKDGKLKQLLPSATEGSTKDAKAEDSPPAVAPSLTNGSTPVESLPPTAVEALTAGADEVSCSFGYLAWVEGMCVCWRGGGG